MSSAQTGTIVPEVNPHSMVKKDLKSEVLSPSEIPKGSVLLRKGRIYHFKAELVYLPKKVEIEGRVKTVLVTSLMGNVRAVHRRWSEISRDCPKDPLSLWNIVKVWDPARPVTKEYIYKTFSKKLKETSKFTTSRTREMRRPVTPDTPPRERYSWYGQ